MLKIGSLLTLPAILFSLHCKRIEHRIVTVANAACLEKPDINSAVVENFSENTIIETQPTNAPFTIKGMYGQDITDIWYKVPKANCHAFGGELALFQYASENTKDLATLAGWWNHLNNLFDKNDSSNWCDEVTQEFCQKGRQFLSAHFQTWRTEIQTFVRNELKGNHRNASLALANGKLSISGDDFKHGAGIKIKLEKGRYRINEN